MDLDPGDGGSKGDDWGVSLEVDACGVEGGQKSGCEVARVEAVLGETDEAVSARVKLRDEMVKLGGGERRM